MTHGWGIDYLGRSLHPPRIGTELQMPMDSPLAWLNLADLLAQISR
jgi:hypothetical protein